MADAAYPVLRQLLVKFQMLMLDRVAATLKTASDMDAALRRAALHTPRDVVQKSEQLEALLLKDMTRREIDCLIFAADSLTGIVDADKFRDATEFEEFARERTMT